MKKERSVATFFLIVRMFLFYIVISGRRQRAFVAGPFFQEVCLIASPHIEV